MEKETLINKLLDGHIEMKENVAKITEIVSRHDTVTFPEMKQDIKNTNEAVTRMESKQNEDLARFVAEKEVIYNRLKPLEDDLASRKQNAGYIRRKTSEILWRGLEKIIYVIIGGAIVAWTTLKTRLFE
jgi:hypothetical protein